MPTPPTLATALLPALDTIRSIRGQLGLNPFTVTVLMRQWSGERPGVGSSLDTTTVLQNAGQPVMVKQLSARDIVASGGLYRDRDMRVGPMTPSYAATFVQPAGGYTDATLDPPVVQGIGGTEIFWLVSGPGMPAGGVYCEKVGEEATALHFSVILRATGRTP